MSNKINGQQKNPLIVAIGASAGGLECYQHFFQSMPSDGGMSLCPWSIIWTLIIRV